MCVCVVCALINVNVKHTILNLVHLDTSRTWKDADATGKPTTSQAALEVQVVLQPKEKKGAK